MSRRGEAGTAAWGPAGGWPGPNWGLERGIVSLSRARPEESSSGDVGTHLNLELASRCDCRRVGRSASGLSALSLPFSQGTKSKDINKKTQPVK